MSTKVAIVMVASVGELIDKIIVLRIKSERVKSTAALTNVRNELELLNDVRGRLRQSAELNSLELSLELDALERKLSSVNLKIWSAEDELRACESAGKFGKKFVELARSACRLRDRRAAIKRSINVLTDSAIVEEKIYGSAQP